MAPFRYEPVYQDTKTNARIGVIHTPHGDIQTPVFVPVGTQGSVKSLDPEEIKAVGSEVFFVNTYHMYLRPGMDVISKFGGLHKFMNWNGPIMTDSGGFQVFSLARGKKFGRPNHDLEPHEPSDKEREAVSLVKLTDDGVEFRSHWDGSKHMFTPTFSMELQWQLGSDIHIAFDDCPAYPVTHEAAKKSMDRTHRWAKESLDAHRKLSLRGVVDEAIFKDRHALRTRDDNPYQALYGSIQGSTFEDLRKESATFIGSMDFDGFAIGGVAVGESKKEMVDVLEWVTPILPRDKPRHLLGVGEIDDIFELVERGVDTFDCVQPTRLARVGRLLVRNKAYELDITNKRYAEDTLPIGSFCDCYTCQHFSRAYLHHLFHVRELLAYRLATIHNLHFVHSLVADIGRSIANGSFLELKEQWLYNER